MKSLEERLMSKVVKGSKPNDCWGWSAFKNDKGYAQLKMAKDKWVGAHRISYELFNGEIPKGLQVCHCCDNPECVNPLHLFTASFRVNMLDKISKGRQNTSRGVGNPHSKFTKEQVLKIRKLSSEGVQTKELKSMYNVNRSTIKDLVAGRTYKNLLPTYGQGV